MPGFRQSLELFRRGEGHRAENVLTGVWRNLPLDIFDYVYDIDQSGRLSRPCTRTVVSLKWPAAFRPITIASEAPLGELVTSLTGPSVEFESAEFNRFFRVRSEDRKFAYDMVHARAMELLLRAREAMPDLRIEIAGDRGFFFRERALQAELIRPLLRFAADFDALIPDYVKKDHAPA